MSSIPDIASKNSLNSALSRLREEKSYSRYLAVSNALDEIGLDGSELIPVRLAILRNFTVDSVIPVIAGETALSGLQSHFYTGGFDTVAQDVFDSSSQLYSFRPDCIILAEWLESLAPQLTGRFLSLSAEQVEDEVNRVLRSIREILVAIRKNLKVPVLLNNFPLPAYPTLGILDGQSESFHTGAILRLNQGLQGMAQESNGGLYIVDLMSLAARLGQDRAFDRRYWHIGRAPIARTALVALGQEYGKFIRALQGKSRKCLVVDCDNTLWGGVVGEDGMGGIKIGGTYPGSCYEAFQQEILNLHDRGVVLAMCSKNNEDEVIKVLQEHPEMQLRVEHFATWEINWDDKATNLRRIAARLNIGLDSIVFADDSQFECDLVRSSMPEVEVIHLGNEPSGFVQMLGKQGCFDSLTFSVEDRVRTKMYHDEARRRGIEELAGSLEDYLQSLEMVATIGQADELTIPRISQLTLKTNQFNLTTRRYSTGEISALSGAPDITVLYMKLRDRVSELGIVGVAILKYQGDSAELDTFLLSCRAIGRGAEEYLLARCIESARAKECKRLVGHYLPTNRNKLVAKFYPSHGFQPLVGATPVDSWELQLDGSAISAPVWIRLEKE
jgi:FkbH-like protein